MKNITLDDIRLSMPGGGVVVKQVVEVVYPCTRLVQAKNVTVSGDKPK